MPTLSSPSTVRRKAEQRDVPFLLQLRALALVPHELAAGIARSSAQQLDRVLAHFESAEVLELKRCPIGVVKVIREPTQWKLLQLQLLPDHQRNGIGTQVVQSVLREAKLAHVPVVLTVLKSNPASRLYERLGFKVVGEREHVYEMRVEA
jgi:ribosomal protein S18 acetylase RimI-like enzyme